MSFHIFHLSHISRFCLRLLVGVSDGDDVTEFVVSRNVEPVDMSQVPWPVQQS